MDLQGVAHRRLADAGRADGDDAVDHLFLALRRRVAGCCLLASLLALRRRAGDLLSFGCSPWRQASAAAGAAGMRALWLQ